MACGDFPCLLPYRAMAGILWENVRNGRRVLFEPGRWYVVIRKYAGVDAPEAPRSILGANMVAVLHSDGKPCLLHVYRVNDNGSLTKINLGD